MNSLVLVFKKSHFLLNCVITQGLREEEKSHPLLRISRARARAHDVYSCARVRGGLFSFSCNFSSMTQTHWRVRKTASVSYLLLFFRRRFLLPRIEFGVPYRRSRIVRTGRSILAGERRHTSQRSDSMQPPHSFLGAVRGRALA